MFADLKTQLNVISALTIRELQGLMRSYNYGFAWALLEPIMFIGIMRVARSAFKGMTPPDMPPSTFLIVGIVPFYLYISASARPTRRWPNPTRCCSFPRVTPIDLALAAGAQRFLHLFRAVLRLLAGVLDLRGRLAAGKTRWR